jgi:hypothetical protein
LCVGEERGESIFEKLQVLHINYPPVVIFSGESQISADLAARQVKTPHILHKPASVSHIDRAMQRAVA